MATRSQPQTSDYLLQDMKGIKMREKFADAGTGIITIITALLMQPAT